MAICSNCGGSGRVYHSYGATATCHSCKGTGRIYTGHVYDNEFYDWKKRQTAQCNYPGSMKCIGCSRDCPYAK